jgi:hypothetical protein
VRIRHSCGPALAYHALLQHSTPLHAYSFSALFRDKPFCTLVVMSANCLVEALVVCVYMHTSARDTHFRAFPATKYASVESFLLRLLANREVKDLQSAALTEFALGNILFAAGEVCFPAPHAHFPWHFMLQLEFELNSSAPKTCVPAARSSSGILLVVLHVTT